MRLIEGASMKRAILSMVCVAALAPAAASAASLDDPLPGHPGVTAFDLARLIVPDLAKGDDGATGRKTIALRHIDGKDALAPPGDPITLGDDAVDLMAVPGRPDRILALIDLGASDGNVEEATVLGLYALSPKLKLLDAAEVGNDRWTGMASKNPPMLAPGSPLIVVDSGHSNSNEAYNSTDLVFVHGDRLALVGNLLTFNQSFCAFDRTQETTYRALPAPGPYASLQVTVRETTKLTGEDGCSDQKPPRKGGVKTYQGVYAWDATKGAFVTHSKPLDALEALNKARVEAP
jgi:hypothetical protein